jgi:hypothetical protein
MSTVGVTANERMHLRVVGRTLRLSRAAAVTVAIMCALVGISVAGTWRLNAPAMDEGITLVYPELMLHGEVPFRDFQSSYGPATYLPLAATYAAFGQSVTVERAVGAGYRLAIVLGIVALMWPLGNGLALAGGSLATVAIMPSLAPEAPVAYGWFFALACLLWALWFGRAALVRMRTERRCSWSWLTSGVLTGVALSARPDLGSAGLLATAVLVYAGRRKALVPFVGGLLLGLAPLIWNIAAAGWSNVMLYGIAAREHQLPLSGYVFPAGIGYLVVLADVALLALLAALRERRRTGPSPINVGWLAIAILTLLMVPQTWQRPDSGHFAFVAPVAFGLLPWTMSRQGLSRAASRLVPLLAGVAVTVSAAASISHWPQSVINGDRRYPLAQPAPAMTRAIDWVDHNVPSGSRLFVGPSNLRWAFWTETELYYLLPQLKPSNFYLELGPGDDDHVFTTRLLTGLRHTDVLILEKLPLKLFRLIIWPKARPGSDKPNQEVRQEFRETFHDSLYSVWVSRRAGWAARLR